MYLFGDFAPSLKAAMNGFEISNHPSWGLDYFNHQTIIEIGTRGRKFISHVIDPSRRAVIGMGRFQWSDIV